MNKLLQRQLLKYGGGADGVPEHLIKLLDIISQSYDHYEKDRGLIERSIELSSKEMIELNAELKKEKEALKQAHKELNTFFENIDEVLYSVDMVAYKPTQMSAACEKVYGYTSEEFLADGNLWQNIILPEDSHIAKQQLQSLKLGKQIFNQYRIIHKDKSIRWIENKIFPTLDETGRLIRIDGVTNDISERKLAEIELEKSFSLLEATIESTAEGILVVDFDGKILRFNNKYTELWGIPKEIADTNDREISIAFVADQLANPEEFVSTIKKLNRKQKATSFDILKFKDGRTFERYSQPQMLNDSCVGRVWSFRDITERINAEENIRNSEERRKLIMNAAMDAIICSDTNGDITFWNPQAEAIFGWKESEVINQRLSRFIIPEQFRKRHDEGMKHYLKTGKGPVLNVLLELSAINRSGEEFPIELTVLPIGQGKDQFFCAFIRDITARKKAETTLRNTLEEKNTILESIDDGFFAVDKNSLVTYWNRKAEILLGETKENIIGKNIHDMFAKPDSRGFYDQYQKAIMENSTVHFEEFSKRSNKWFAVSAFASEHGMSVYFKDVTERKKAEEEIKLSEIRYRSLIEQATDAICITDASMKFIDINPYGLEIFGYTITEALQLSLPDILFAEDMPDNPLKVDELKLGKTVRNERRLKKKDGTTVDMEVSTKLMADGRLIMFGHDITERKKSEQSNKFKAELLNTIGQAVMAADLDGTISFWNKAAEDLYGWTSEEAIGSNVLTLIPSQQTKAEAMKIIEQLHLGLDWSGELMMQRKDGTSFMAFIIDSPVHDKYHNLTGIIGVSIDISERIKNDLLIKESERRYRTLFEQNLAGFYQSTRNGVILKCNLAFAKMLKYDSPQELLKINAKELYFSPQDRIDFISSLAEKKILNNYEGILKCKDGTPLYFLENISEQTDALTGEFFLDGILLDISDKKMSEFQLNESNERFMNVSKATSDVIWDWDLLKHTMYRGESFQTIFGHDPAKQKNDPSAWKNNIHPDDVDRVSKKIHDFIATNETSWVDEYRYLKTDQTYAYVIDKAFAIRNDHGVVIRMVGAMQDITEKKELEDLLNKTNALARIGSWEINLVTKTIYWSDMVREIHEVSSDYIPDFLASVNFVKEGENRELVTKKIQDSIEKGTTSEIEFQIITAKGNTRWVHASGDAEFINGECVRIYGSLQDIDERKKSEFLSLAVLNEKNTILESIGDGFFAVDHNWTVNYWNNQAEKLLRTPKEVILGQNLWEIFSESTESVSYKNYHEALETNKVVHFEDYFEALTSWFEISAYPSNNGLSVYFKDITDRKLSEIHFNKLNENLRIQTKELALSNMELEQFAYVASHDLQEPLRMVTSFLTQLEKRYGAVIDDKGKQYIAFAVDGAKRMRQIILDLLEFSRVGKLGGGMENLNLNELINEIQILFRKKIEEKKAIIVVDQLPLLHTYQPPIRQVFQNLIGNALKYSGKDKAVKIHISAKEFDDRWQFAIKDDGIGIEEEYFEKIFIIFQRLHHKKEFSGTGMGLAITKKIIENQGGTIWVESEAGTGSTFYFTLLKQT